LQTHDQQEEFEDTKGIIRIHKSKTDNMMANRKGTKGQTMIYKALHITRVTRTPLKAGGELRCSY